MVDTVTTAPMANANDDWEVAVDSGEFDKRIERQDKARTPDQEPVISFISSSTMNDDDSQSSSSINLMKANKPIRILKRPTSQSQLPTPAEVTNSSATIATAATAATTSTNNTNPNNSNSPLSHNATSSATVPVISIIPRNPAKDSVDTLPLSYMPSFSSIASSSQSTKPAIKTYEQREQEYRLARLRIMGEEESSVKDDDDDAPVTDTVSVPTDESAKPVSSTASSTSSATRTTNKQSGPSQQQQQPLQCHSTPGSYASNLYALNNAPSNIGTIHFSPNHNSTPSMGAGPYSSPNFPQHYRGNYSAPYSHVPPPHSVPRYPLTSTTANTLYMTSTAPFVTAPSSSSSYHNPPSQPVHMTTNHWYSYPHQQTPYGAQQYGHPQ